MRVFLLFCLAVLLSWLYAPQAIFSQKASASAAVRVNRPVQLTEASLAGRDVYFFIEAECAGCSPGAGLPAGKYWVISRGIQQNTYDGHNAAMERYREALRSRFERPRPFLDALVFQFQFSRGEAENVRQAELAARQKAGYQVIEIDLEQ